MGTRLVKASCDPLSWLFISILGAVCRTALHEMISLVTVANF